MSLAPGKFRNPELTAKGERRASVALKSLETLWFNTGTLCNIECANCYIASSPTNDRLVWLSPADVAACLTEAEALHTRPSMTGFTGGEPFMNPDMPAILNQTLARGYNVLILTNAMKPLMRPRVQAALAALGNAHRAKLVLRVSLDHWRPELHEEERGPGSFDEALDGIRWLRDHGFRIAIAARLRWGDRDEDMRAGFAALFAREDLSIDAADPANLVIFPEMDETIDVPEITTACWGILDKNPDDMMCASSRMVIRRKGAATPTYVACTLLPYDTQFELGHTLESAVAPVSLNHPHCAKFCVLGGGSCKA